MTGSSYEAGEVISPASLLDNKLFLIARGSVLSTTVCWSSSNITRAPSVSQMLCVVLKCLFQASCSILERHNRVPMQQANSVLFCHTCSTSLASLCSCMCADCDLQISQFISVQNLAMKWPVTIHFCAKSSHEMACNSNFALQLISVDAGSTDHHSWDQQDSLGRTEWRHNQCWNCHRSSSRHGDRTKSQKNNKLSRRSKLHTGLQFRLRRSKTEASGKSGIRTQVYRFRVCRTNRYTNSPCQSGQI